MKKYVSMILVSLLVGSMVGCSSQSVPVEEEKQQEQTVEDITEEKTEEETETNEEEQYVINTLKANPPTVYATLLDNGDVYGGHVHADTECHFYKRKVMGTYLNTISGKANEEIFANASFCSVCFPTIYPNTKFSELFVEEQEEEFDVNHQVIDGDTVDFSECEKCGGDYCTFTNGETGEVSSWCSECDYVRGENK